MVESRVTAISAPLSVVRTREFGETVLMLPRARLTDAAEGGFWARAGESETLRSVATSIRIVRSCQSLEFIAFDRKELWVHPSLASRSLDVAQRVFCYTPNSIGSVNTGSTLRNSGDEGIDSLTVPGQQGQAAGVVEYVLSFGSRTSAFQFIVQFIRIKRSNP